MRPTLQDGVEGLWRLQLRKEHAVLLEQQQNYVNIVESLKTKVAEISQDFERQLTSIVDKFSDTEANVLELGRACERQGNEMTAMKLEIGAMNNKLGVEFQQRDRVGFATETVKPTFDSLKESDIQLIPDGRRTVPSAVAQNNRLLDSSEEMVAEKAPTPVPMRDEPLQCAREDVPVNSTRRAIEASVMGTSVVERPVSFRSHGHFLEIKRQRRVPRNTTNVGLEAKSTTFPRLNQSHSSLQKYLSRADRALQSHLSDNKNRSPELELEFIAAFIDGINNERYREKLMEELQLEHQSRTKKDGRVEILCRWKDVAVGMKNAGLFAASGNKLRNMFRNP